MNEDDRELAAIKAVAAAIVDLDEVERRRVFDYISSRFGVAISNDNISTYQSASAVTPVMDSGRNAPTIELETTMPVDIKSLKVDRKPTGALQMAVLVAYYLKALAPVEERKDTIGTEDIERYFTQAQYPLPSGKNGAVDTLNNARKAGYFESAGQGVFKLNSVGFNLAAYGMPTAKVATTRPNRTSSKKVVKKATKKK